MDEATILERLMSLQFDSWEATAASVAGIAIFVTGLIKKWKPIWTQSKEVKLGVSGALCAAGAIGLKLADVGYLSYGDWYPHVVGVWLASVVAAGFLYDKALPLLKIIVAGLKDRAEPQNRQRGGRGL